MATRTRYRRGSSSAYGYGGGWLRSWFGGAPPAASPGAGGSSAVAFQNVQRAAQSAPEAPYQALQSALTMGGKVLGTSQNGAITYVEIGGMVVSFNSATGVQVGQPVPANAAAGGGPPATPPGGGGDPRGGAGPQGGAPQGGGGPASRVGQQVSAQTANGVVTGTITGEENGVTTVRWSDGTVATYGADGQLVNSTPPASTPPTGGETPAGEGEAPAGETPPTETPPTSGAGAGVVPADPTDVPPPPLPGPVGPQGPVGPDTYVAPAPVAGTPSDPDNPYSAAYNPLAPSAPPTMDQGGMAPPVGPVGPAGPAQVAAMAAPAPVGSPAPAYQAPAPAYQPPPTPIDQAQRAGERSSYVPPPEPQISTQWGWLTPSQLETMFASTYNAPPEMAPTPPPAPPTAPSPAASYPSFDDPASADYLGYTPPPPPPQYGSGGSGFYS